ncbi:helix-turn-helix transcriptional regulator [Clostridium sp. AWRP]|uniref:helix-turn-helix transcriptional regulator n=1 Tax=Clostridium sp. AWRP TaxID=2212991 RepID=UPI000FDC0842|nr:helix-turn-helix transcriptional regulator [Clostridium sp. AWRP]AZV57510.1 helix-turn-helix domain-containing protein [Clostridium sp. AWRP]
MEEQRYEELGNFLKIRRSEISPSQVGLPEGLRRRTPGLRREEVAYLSGVSLTWYTWLEQGRPINVSAEVIESLSRALMLDKQERVHLYTLAKQVPPSAIPLYQSTVNTSLQHVLDNLILSPSYIMDARWNVIAWNKSASVVFANFNKIQVTQRNIIWMMFNNFDYKNLFIDWESTSQGIISRFRSNYAKYIDDPWMVSFVHNLEIKNEEFNLFWSKHNVQIKSEIHKKINHPIVGTMTFEFNSFDISDSSNLKLIVNTPLSKTDTDVKVKSLLYK